MGPVLINTNKVRYYAYVEKPKPVMLDGWGDIRTFCASRPASIFCCSAACLISAVSMACWVWEVFTCIAALAIVFISTLHLRLPVSQEIWIEASNKPG